MNEAKKAIVKNVLRFVAVLQVSGPGTAVQLWPAGYASTEETNVQRTL